MEALNPALHGAALSLFNCCFDDADGSFCLPRAGISFRDLVIEASALLEKSSRELSFSKSDSRGIFSGIETVDSTTLFLILSVRVTFLELLVRFPLGALGRIGKVAEDADGATSLDILLSKPSF